ncbi:hypothetical protein ACTGY1_10420, partial [Streptococcus suis]
MTGRTGSVAMVAAMAAGLVVPAYAQQAGQGAAQTVEPLIPASGAVLEVSAEGRTTRVPDLATIRAGVV